MPEAGKHLGLPASGGTGWWMSVLLDRLKRRSDLKVAIVASAGWRDAHFEKDGVEYFVVKTPLRRAIWSYLGSYRDRVPIRRQLAKYASILREWKPDVVHVHGTESEFGLIKAWGLSAVPFAVSIQGLMTPYAANAFGDLLPAELHGAIRSAIGLRARCLERWKGFRMRIPYEEAILRAADTVMGRTGWDRAWACAYRQDVRYRRVDEVMRAEFYQAAPWSIESCRPRQIFTTSGCEPLKGVHVLIEAVYRLRDVFPDVCVNIAADGFLPRPQNDYARFVLDQIDRLGLANAVTFLGHLDGNAIVRQLQRAHCYAMPSFIENSSNALQEAMLVGTPSVASNAGGTTSILEDERSGLTFPASDSALLAWQVARVFKDDRLAAKLSREARFAATVRNDPVRVEAQLLSVYEELVGVGVVR
jgi:glycosyltransferase involved in cell wall biosynthesis